MNRVRNVSGGFCLKKRKKEKTRNNFNEMINPKTYGYIWSLYHGYLVCMPSKQKPSDTFPWPEATGDKLPHGFGCPAAALFVSLGQTVEI